jgi:hypothetical protein
MTLGGKQLNGPLLVAAAILVTVASDTVAQDAGGVDANLSFSQGLNYSDDDGTVGRTELGFDLSSVTRNQSLNFQIDTALEQGGNDSDLFELIDPAARMSYSVESREAAVTTDLSYRQSDSDSFVEDQNGVPGVLVFDDGTREDLNAKVDLVFGRDALFGGSVNLAYRALNYSNTTSTALIDTETLSGGLGLRFEVDPRITLTFDYDQSETDRDTGSDSLSQRLNFGAQFVVSQNLDASVTAGLSRIENTNVGVGSVDDGLAYGIQLTQERPLGTLRFSFDSDLFETGRRTTAEVGGTLETRRANWDADIGLSQGEEGKTRPLLSVSFGEDLANGAYSVSLRQAFNVSSAGDETLNSQLAINWNRDLTQTSGLSTSLTYQLTDVLGADDDSEKFEISLNYGRDLTEDWALSTRYTHSIVDKDGSAREWNNEVFIGLETSFGWRR